VLARHCTEAGLIEKAAGLWGKAGQQSQARSALAEAAAQLNGCDAPETGTGEEVALGVSNKVTGGGMSEPRAYYNEMDMMPSSWHVAEDALGCAAQPFTCALVMSNTE
jgi:hypothetical protein